ncbi:hypothetical protein [Serratia sp. M24T3]|uniref:hypothetical protein n=1 Tax=Serratia sp. M24T3 TaxID=932213 RepID=UPI00025B9471|nr:hypothetical protein [Serratia sp. M24T3]EIC82527.1 hypothetical protein SPM24T3_21544 [Serratia sp. M24T3]
MVINKTSSPAMLRSVSESSIYQSTCDSDSTHSLDYLDLAQASQQLTNKLLFALQQPSEAEITATLGALNEILIAAERQESDDSFSTLSTDAQLLCDELSHYIFENEALVDCELCSRLRDINDSNPPPQSHYEGCWMRLKNVLCMAADGDVCRYLHNARNIAVRTVLCVALPTLLRQIVAYGTEYIFSEASRFTLATLAGTLPLILNLAGGVREYLQGTSTAVGTFSRALNIGVSAAAMIAAASTGVLAGLASTMVSFQAYSVMREGAQSCIRLDNHLPVKAISTFATAGMYIPNQIATSLTMSAIASPSGSAAALLQANYRDVWLNDLSRAALNTLGEAADLSVFSGLNAMQNRIKLRNELTIGLPDKKHMADTFFNALAARMALMNTPILVSTALNTALAEYFDQHTLGQLDDIICAGVLGCLYPSFVATIVAHPDKPDISDISEA